MPTSPGGSIRQRYCSIARPCRYLPPRPSPAGRPTRVSRLTIQTGEDRFNHPFRLLGISDLDGHDTGFFDRIVVPTREQGIADEQHLVNGTAEGLAELLDPVGLIDAALGDINGRRATQT